MSKPLVSEDHVTFEIRPRNLIILVLVTFAAGYLIAAYRLWWLPMRYHVAPPSGIFSTVERPGSSDDAKASSTSAGSPAAVAVTTVTLVPTEARASTWMKRPSHPAKDAFDGDFSTNWTETHVGRGEGQWIEAVYASPVRVTEIIVATGIIGGCGNEASASFEKNSRLKTFRIVLSDGTEIKASAADGERCVIVPVAAKETKSVKLIVDSVWPGTTYRDLGIAEIKIVGTKP